MKRTKQLKQLIRDHNSTDCERGKCGHSYQYEHCKNDPSNKWCTDCAGNIPITEIRLPNGEITRGHIMGNVSEEFIEAIQAG